ncbi:MAG: trypsin-like peptidase domain-containing protein [Nitrospirae bacterium]|nr:trypsin-like peptidase domain-containing protein [Candidatus Manganitrophaceae bacterium]
MIHQLAGWAVAALIVLLPRMGYPQSEGAGLVPSHIHNAVYEVIVAKPPEASLTYEKPLPMELLPFTIRNDKYYSIGTAFAMNETELITAAHVLNLGVRSQFKEIFLRDINGKVFPLDNIIKFSSRRDFVVFTVKGRTSPEHLELNPNSQINEKVYAVGNALGEGIVMRDGLYTSNTPEEIDGAWNWIRFSAAASPGNSGGPLLDHNGKVIGVMIRKSPNENLNMALPAAEVQKADSRFAEIYQKSVYQLDIFDSIKTGTLDTQIKLPMGYNDFRKSYIDLRNEFNIQLLKALLAENKETLFPNGAGAQKLLYKNMAPEFPQLIVKRVDGNWDAASPEKLDRSDLGNRGYITHGRVKSTLFLKIQKPDTVSLSDFYSDSKLFMDLILKGIPWFRLIGPERIKVTSLGKADSESIYIDAYGRKWMVKTWPIPYGDQEMVAFSLPVPGGTVTMLRVDQTGDALDGHIPDLKTLSDFINLSFDGTFKKWREYLGMKEIIPPLFNSIELTVNKDEFRYKSKRFKVSATSEVIPLSDQSMLTIGFGYYRGSDHSTIWDVSRLFFNEDNFKHNGFTLNRNMKVDEEVDDADLNRWKRLLEGDKPYDMKAYLLKDNTAISTVYKNVSAMKTSQTVSVLYDLTHIKTGMVDQSTMESSLSKVLKEVVVYEN